MINAWELLFNLKVARATYYTVKLVASYNYFDIQPVNLTILVIVNLLFYAHIFL